MSGYVYFIADWNDEKKMPNTVKIGMTGKADINARLSSLQTGNPFKLKVIAAVALENAEMASQCEKLLHSKFRSHRLNGEWFKYDLEIEDFIDFGLKYFGDYCTTPDLGLVRHGQDDLQAFSGFEV